MKPHRLYIRIGRTDIQIVALNTAEHFLHKLLVPFSHPRVVIADFGHALSELKNVFRNYPTLKAKWFQQTHVLIQQTEGVEGGLSAIEKRALRDLAEDFGGSKVVVLEDVKERSIPEALLLLSGL